MSEPIRCFVIEPTAKARRYLRRYRGGEKSVCQVNGYHTAEAAIGDVEYEKPYAGEGREVGDDHPTLTRDDPRWPKTCACGYAFEPGDHWQEQIGRLYRGVHPERGEVVVTLDEAPAGAMWRAPWYEEVESWRGPDGQSWVVQCPPGPWTIDCPATDGKPWTRTGVAPNFTVRPSILFQRTGYHAFLTDGVLVPC